MPEFLCSQLKANFSHSHLSIIHEQVKYTFKSTSIMTHENHNNAAQFKFYAIHSKKYVSVPSHGNTDFTWEKIEIWFKKIHSQLIVLVNTIEGALNYQRTTNVVTQPSQSCHKGKAIFIDETSSLSRTTMHYSPFISQV